MPKINDVADLGFEGEVAILTLNSPPVNALSGPMLEALRDGFKAADAAPQTKAIVLICAGRTFIAGADISAFTSMSSGAGFAEAGAAIEGVSKPTVAAIHGTALGGGLEMALNCNYRVAVPSAKLGLPEVHLGLLPGAGGTQRLPRVVGVEKALEMVTSGKPVSAKEALSLGLIDAIVEEGKLQEQAVAFARKLIADKAPLRRIRDADEKLAEARRKPEIFETFRKANGRKFRGFKAPEHNIRAIEAAVNAPDFDAGIKEEQRLFMELLFSPESAAQRYAFFSERAIGKIPDIGPEVETLPIRKVGVIGAGTMGGGIAMNFANAGIPVTMVEMAQANLDRGLGVIRKNYENTAARGGMSAEDVDARMGLLGGSLDLQALADADLIIEAVFENLEVKKEVFRKLDAVAKPDAILATNTSFLDVNAIAAATNRADHVIGLHFFSPANVMKLLEIVRPEKAAKPVVATAVKLAKQIGKIGVLTGVCHGFIGNRMLEPRQAQANELVLEGAEIADVDRVIYEFGFPMGPFAMMDLVGLDVLKDPPGVKSIAGTLVEQGRLGQKGGGGYYDYDEKRNPKPSETTTKVVADFRTASGKTQRKIDDQEILERCLYVMVNEGAKILEEGIAIRSSDIDIVWMYGYGWPPYKGGPMYYADELVGLPKILERLKAYQAEHGDVFRPSALLEKLVAEGKKFSDFK